MRPTPTVTDVACNGHGADVAGHTRHALTAFPLRRRGCCSIDGVMAASFVIVAAGVWSVLATLGWLALYRRGRRGASRVAAVEDVVVDVGGVNDDVRVWPRVSLIVPASNEGETLPSALSSLLALDYPNYEIVVVDDRSTDGTGAAIAAAAARDPRVRPVRVDVLPDGWLGKVHAQTRGIDAATGDWLLFTDADVVFGKDALRRAVAHVQAKNLEHLVIVARGRPPTFALDVVECALATMLHGAAAVSRSKERVVGSGQFSMVKRSALDKSDGLAWLKMEPADDFGLSLLMKRSGAAQEFFISRGDVSWVWYPSFMAMVRGFEKNLFPVATGYRAVPALVIAFGIFAFNVGPFVGTIAFGWPGLGLSALALLALLSATIARQRLSGRRFSVLVCGPLGQLVLAFVLVRSMVVVLGGGGIRWRGTFYPLAALRAGQRVRTRSGSQARRA